MSILTISCDMFARILPWQEGQEGVEVRSHVLATSSIKMVVLTLLWLFPSASTQPPLLSPLLSLDVAAADDNDDDDDDDAVTISADDDAAVVVVVAAVVDAGVVDDDDVVEVDNTAVSHGHTPRHLGFSPH